MALTFVLGLLAGVGKRKSDDRAAAAAEERWRSRLDYQYQMARTAASDPMHPSYWGVQSKKADFALKMMQVQGGSGSAFLGVEGMVDQWSGLNGGFIPEWGSDQGRDLLSIVGSGLPFEEGMKADDEWSQSRLNAGRSLTRSVLGEGDLVLGRGPSGKEITLSRGAFGEDLNGVEFMSKAVDRYSPFLSLVQEMGSEGGVTETALLAMKFGDDKEAKARFQEAKQFWTTGPGAVFYKQHGMAAANEMQIALGRMGRAMGYDGARRAFRDVEAAGGPPPTGEATLIPEELDSRLPDPGRENESRPREAAPATRGPEESGWGDQPIPMEDQMVMPQQEMDFLLGDPGQSEQAMGVQYQAVVQALQTLQNTPIDEIDPRTLQFLETKMAQGFWSHLIAPGIEMAKRKMHEAMIADRLDSSLRMIGGEAPLHLSGRR